MDKDSAIATHSDLGSAQLSQGSVESIPSIGNAGSDPGFESLPLSQISLDSSSSIVNPGGFETLSVDAFHS